MTQNKDNLIGLMTPDQERFLAEALYSLIKSKKKIPGIIKLILRFIIKLIDNKKLDKMPVEHKKQLIPIVNYAYNNDFKNFEVACATLLNQKIDIPKIPEMVEQIIFETLIKIFAFALKEHVFNKKMVEKP